MQPDDAPSTIGDAASAEQPSPVVETPGVNTALRTTHVLAAVSGLDEAVAVDIAGRCGHTPTTPAVTVDPIDDAPLSKRPPSPRWTSDAVAAVHRVAVALRAGVDLDQAIADERGRTDATA